MIAGHYASALFARTAQPQAHFGLFLVAALLQDMLWLVFAMVGWEPTAPHSVVEASLQNVVVEMTYSHDLVPAVGWMVVSAVLGLLATRKMAVAILCALLSAGHEVLDLLAGFQHHIAGPHSAGIGFNLWGLAPHTAVLIEAAFCAVAVGWYLRAEANAGRPVARTKAIKLNVLLVGGALSTLPVAGRSLQDWIG